MAHQDFAVTVAPGTSQLIGAEQARKRESSICSVGWHRKAYPVSTDLYGDQRRVRPSAFGQLNECDVPSAITLRRDD